MSRFAVLLALVSLSAIKVALGHSWLACADYQQPDRSPTASSIRQYDNSLCRGFPRDWTIYNGGAFGVDRGFNRQATGSAPACATSLTGASYTATFPMATYTPGQRVRLVWPAKNHDAATCTNPFIPDTSMKIFMLCGANRKEGNPTVDDFLRNGVLVSDLKAISRPDYAPPGTPWDPGFQNCPFFCENMDKSVCFQEVNIPQSASGECTFLWYWIFNENTPPYLTCWDARISGAATPAPTNAPTFAPTQPPTFAPTRAPTFAPTQAPTQPPTRSPTFAPSNSPTFTPTQAPTQRANTPVPTFAPPPAPTRDVPVDDSPGDTVEIVSRPSASVIARSDRFSVRMSYNSVTADAKIVVCELNQVNSAGVVTANLGSGIRHIRLNPGAGTGTVIVRVPAAPAARSMARVECWIVLADDYDADPSTAYWWELDRDITAGFTF